jgi:hypothetical protein
MHVEVQSLFGLVRVCIDEGHVIQLRMFSAVGRQPFGPKMLIYDAQNSRMPQKLGRFEDTATGSICLPPP